MMSTARQWAAFRYRRGRGLDYSLETDRDSGEQVRKQVAILVGGKRTVPCWSDAASTATDYSSSTASATSTTSTINSMRSSIARTSSKKI